MACFWFLTFWWAWPDVQGGGFHRTKSLGRLAWPPSSCSWSWQLGSTVSSAPSSWLCPWRRSFPFQRRDCCSSGRRPTSPWRLGGRKKVHHSCCLTRWQACQSGCCCCSSQTGRTRRLPCLDGKSVGPTSSPNPEIQLQIVWRLILQKKFLEVREFFLNF